MTPFDRFLLQADSFVILIALIVYLFKALNKDNGINKNFEENTSSNEISADMVPLPSIKTGYTEGETQTVGINDDEIACVILAAVSTASMIPLKSLRIKSIKSIEN